MDDIYKLEHLSLVNKLTQEIQNHTGLNDSSVAEFVIAIHEKSKTKEKFVNNLKKNGAEFPPTLVDSLDRLILTMHPKYKRKAAEKQMNGEAGNNASEKSRMFPGLAIPDQQWQAARPDTKDEKNATEKEVDDLLSQLEGVAAKKSRPPDAMDLEEPPVKRQRRDDDRDGRRRSMSPPYRNGGYGDRDRGRYDDAPPRGRRDDRGGYGRRHLDERPVLYKIYDGRVSNIKDFGAFVTLEGVAGRVEGMSDVHWLTTTAHGSFTRSSACFRDTAGWSRELCRRSPDPESVRQGESHERCGGSGQPLYQGCRPGHRP